MANDELNTHLNRLLGFFTKNFAQAVWERILIVEDTMIKQDMSYRISRSAFFTPNDYSGRFAWLLTQRYSWINLQAAGVFGNTLLIVVELPKYESNTPSTTVNLSGPYLIKGKESWNISDSVIITDESF
ncbi:MAG TPA: hypothetical protein VFZ34_21790 [Blastocatellia bacterium]|nr:hypothetical protein [Blastocatellia bacterium]